MVVHGGTWWYMVVHGGPWWYMVVHGGTGREKAPYWSSPTSRNQLFGLPGFFVDFVSINADATEVSAIARSIVRSIARLPTVSLPVLSSFNDLLRPCAGPLVRRGVQHCCFDRRDSRMAVTRTVTWPWHTQPRGLWHARSCSLWHTQSQSRDGVAVR
jgi:hypothetical protein